MLDQKAKANPPKSNHVIAEVFKRELSNDNFLTAVRRNPYGMISFVIDKGTLPEKYTGQYTTVEAAELAAAHYIEDRKAIEAEIEQLKAK